MEKIGIDVHEVATQVCILTEEGEFKEFRILRAERRLTRPLRVAVVAPSYVRGPDVRSLRRRLAVATRRLSKLPPSLATLTAETLGVYVFHLFILYG